MSAPPHPDINNNNIISSPSRLINVHVLLESTPYEPPASPNGNGLVYLLSAPHEIIFKAAHHHHPAALAAATREQTIYSLIESGTLRLPQSPTHYLSYPHHGTFMAYLPNGTLFARVLAEQQSPSLLPTTATTTPSPPPLPHDALLRRMRWILQLTRIARAFAHRDLDHGDWQPRNLVLDRHDNLNIVDFSSVVQFGTRILKRGPAAFNHQPSADETAGYGSSNWAADQAWWLEARRRWPADVFPHEFGLDRLLRSYEDGERGHDVFATERRTCFSLACLFYFIMAGAEPHPVMFEGQRLHGHELPLSAKGKQPLGMGGSTLLADPEHPHFRPFGLLGSVVRACWSGKVAGVCVLAAMLREIGVQVCDEMGWDATMVDELLGSGMVDSIPIVTKEVVAKKRAICEGFVQSWAKAQDVL